MKTAFITGFTGQDGTFLTKFLLEKGYRVIGLTRRISTEPPMRQRGKFDFSEALKDGQLVLEPGDLLSRSSLDRILEKWSPEEIYNLGAQSHVGTSFTQPEFTTDVNYMGVVNLLEALESYTGWRMYQASTSEMFGDVKPGAGSLNEETPFNPVSPYSIAKTAAHYYCRMKRSQGKFVACGILFNHESEIRGGDFVTQKIIRGLLTETPGEVLEVGNLESIRDWGYAGDYVEAMWLMLQQDKPEEFVIGTGETHSVREFIEAAVGERYKRNVTWHGPDQKRRCRDYGSVNGIEIVRSVDRLYRPNEVGYLKADTSKAKGMLGWEPKTSFLSMVRIMIYAAMEDPRLRRVTV